LFKHIRNFNRDDPVFEPEKPINQVRYEVKKKNCDEDKISEEWLVLLMKGNRLPVNSNSQCNCICVLNYAKE